MEILELICKISESKILLDVFIAEQTIQLRKIVKVKKRQQKLFKLILREYCDGEKMKKNLSDPRTVQTNLISAWLEFPKEKRDCSRKKI